MWRDQAEHVAESLTKGSQVVVWVSRSRPGPLRNGSARSTVEVVAEELVPSLRWTKATMSRTTQSQDQ